MTGHYRKFGSGLGDLRRLPTILEFIELEGGWYVNYGLFGVFVLL